MKIKCVNLVPSHRKDARARKSRLRAWSLGGGGYVILLITACGMSYALWGGDQAAVAAQSGRATRQVEEAQRIIAKLQPELAEAQARLDVIRLVSEQPDWSVLLRLLARSATDQIVLTSCKLEEAVNSSKSLARVPTTQPDSLNRMLSVTGYGRSQAEVSRFVLRLEEARLFDQVSLLKTSREAYGAGEAFAFRIECQLSNGGAR